MAEISIVTPKIHSSLVDSNTIYFVFSIVCIPNTRIESWEKEAVERTMVYHTIYDEFGYTTLECIL